MRNVRLKLCCSIAYGFPGGSWKPILRFDVLFGSHEFLDGVDEVLNCGVVVPGGGLIVYFGGKLPVFDQHFPQYANEGADHKNAHLDVCLELNGCGHDGAVLGEGVGR
jgi:hypothetical protein